MIRRITLEKTFPLTEAPRIIRLAAISCTGHSLLCDPCYVRGPILEGKENLQSIAGTPSAVQTWSLNEARIVVISGERKEQKNETRQPARRAGFFPGWICRRRPTRRRI